MTGNLYALFEERFAAAGDDVAVRSPGGQILMTYAGLAAAVSRYANALVELGVLPGDRIAAPVEKSLANVMLYLAALKAGAVYQPLNPAYTAAEIDYFVADAEPKVIVCDPSRQAEMRAIADRHGVPAVVNIDAEGEGSLAVLAANMPERHEAVPRAADDLAALLYTSGTTGRSKGAILTHGNLASNALTLHKLWAFEKGDVLLHALPIFHVHGLFVALNTAFLNGSEIVWLGRFDLESLIDALPRATVLMGVPTFYTRLLGSPRFTREACRSMRLFISGSAPLPAATHAEFARRTGHAILERYGMTETGMIASNTYDGERIPGTVGFALPDVGLRIADNAGGELKRGEIGVIEVKGPNVFKGYWRQPAKTAEEFRAEGWFVTGDIGCMDEEGRVTIVGRAKDVIISGGFNVYPKEVEAELEALPGIGEAAVVGVPHPDLGEAVIAIVTGTAEEAQAIAALSRRLAKFKLPRRVVAMAELPRNAMGKVRKAELRDRFAGLFTQA